MELPADLFGRIAPELTAEEEIYYTLKGFPTCPELAAWWQTQMPPDSEYAYTYLVVWVPLKTASLAKKVDILRTIGYFDL